MLEKWIRILFRFLPHAVIALTVWFIAVYIGDYYNQTMAFINNNITKTLMLIFSVLSAINAVCLVIYQVKNKKNK